MPLPLIHVLVRLIPSVASLIGLALVLVALMAGKNPGQLEEFSIIRFNTSELGKNLIGNLTDTSSLCSEAGSITGFLGTACSDASSVLTSAVDELRDAENDIADALADALGLHQFYSLHVQNICEGYFTPSPTAANATYNVTGCSGGGFNVSALLDRDLQLGPFDLSLADLGLSQDLVDKLDDIPKAFNVLLWLFGLSAALAGLSLVASLVASSMLPRISRHHLLLVAITISIVFIAALVLSIIAAVLHSSISWIVDQVNDLGGSFGLSATYGDAFARLTWAAFAFLAINWLYWCVESIQVLRGRFRNRGPYARSGSEKAWGYDSA